MPQPPTTSTPRNARRRRWATCLCLADAERWATPRLGYTDPAGASWLRAAIAAGHEAVGERDPVYFAGAQEALYAALHALLQPDDYAVLVLPSHQSIETIPLGLCW